MKQSLVNGQPNVNLLRQYQAPVPTPPPPGYQAEDDEEILKKLYDVAPEIADLAKNMPQDLTNLRGILHPNRLTAGSVKGWVEMDSGAIL